MPPDANLVRVALDALAPHLNTIFNGILIASIGGVAKMIHSRFQINEIDHKEIINHLAILNGRMGRAEVWREEHEKLAETLQHQLEQTRAQCQQANRREFDALWRQLGQRKTDRDFDGA